MMDGNMMDGKTYGSLRPDICDPSHVGSYVNSVSIPFSSYSI